MLGVAVGTQELALGCLIKDLCPLEVCERSHIQLKGLLRGILVMKFKGRVVAVIAAYRATTSK